MRKSQIAIGVVAATVLGAAAWWIYRPAAIAVETTTIARQDFQVIVEADGRTRVRDRYVVSAPVAGRTLRSPLRVGDVVAAGEPVATLRANLPPLLDPRARRELEERLGSAEAQVDEAEALQARARVSVDRAETDLRRTRELRERGVAPAAALDRDTFAAEQARRDLRAAERRFHAAEHGRAEAREALRRSADPASAEIIVLTAPAAGTVLRVTQESEAPVQTGAALVEIGDPTEIEVIADLLTTEAVAIRAGAPVSIERWGGATALEGRVRRIEPTGFTKISALGVEEQRVWVVIDFQGPARVREGLADGFRVETRIVAERIADALVVPAGALFRQGNDWRLFAIEHDRARVRTVTAVRRSGRLVAIAGGVEAGAEIVVFPPSTLSDGARVTRIGATR